MNDGECHRRSDCLLMIAARAPVAGETKTRLGRAIGMERAAALYRAFLVDLAARLSPNGTPHPFDLAWTHSPPEVDFAAVMADVTGSDPVPFNFVPQDGPDWGTRQANLLRHAHDLGYPLAILIASDSPHLTRETIETGFAMLREADVALGRVRDGGYYLIGQRLEGRGYVDVLSRVPMSTASAADGVVAVSARLGLRVVETHATFDVDEADDLDHLIAHLAPDGANCPATWAALRELGLLDRSREGAS
ncbi:MAG: TIGR04282 family arsenosugar biosynthesis glycosyltransferase [Thermomicrobiales bacterium]